MGIAATRTPDRSISRRGSCTCPLRVHTFVMCDATAHGDSVMSETRDILHRARTQREGDCDTRERISPPEDWPSAADLYYPVWYADVPSAPWLHREWVTTHTENSLCCSGSLSLCDSNPRTRLSPLESLLITRLDHRGGVFGVHLGRF